MAEQFSRPDPGRIAAAVRSRADRVPGQRDMTAFERALAGPPAEGPRLVWLLTWPDGRAVSVDSEDHALAIAREARVCRMARRYVTPGVAR